MKITKSSNIDSISVLITNENERYNRKGYGIIFSVIQAIQFLNFIHR